MKRFIIAALALLGLGGMAQAQDYPDRPVSIIIPYAAGGSGDLSARFVADALGKAWNQTVTAENVTGGGTLIGSVKVQQSAPDGYTLLLHGVSLPMLAAARSDVPFDVTNDFVPVAIISDTQFVLAVGPSVKATTIEEFLEEGKSRTLLGATSGPGTSTHFANELLASATGISVKNVHYKGGGEAIVDVAGGRADFYVSTVTSARSFIDSGDVRLLAAMGDQRLPALPDVPTFKETGIDVQIGLWWAIFAPGGTPDDVVEKLNTAIHAAMLSPEGTAFLEQQQALVNDLDAAGFKAFFLSEVAKWKDVAEKQGIKLE